MAQAVSAMPYLDIEAEETKPFRDILKNAVDRADPALEIIQYYQTELWAFFVAVPPRGADFTQEQAWTEIGYEQSNNHYFGVTADGRLVVDDAGFQRTSLGDLSRGVSDGYFDGDWTRVVLIGPVGRGGGSPSLDLIDFLREMGVEVSLSIAPWLFGRFRSKYRLAKQTKTLREIASTWATGGLQRPWVLRQWLDTKPDWTVAEISVRLALPKSVARQLLVALGYERRPASPLWALGVSRSARRKRDRWLKREWDGPF